MNQSRAAVDDVASSWTTTWVSGPTPQRDSTWANCSSGKGVPPGTARARQIAIEVCEHRAGKMTLFILLAGGRSFHRPAQVDEPGIRVRLYPNRIHEEGDVGHARIL